MKIYEDSRSALPNPSPPSSGRLLGLDAARGLAIFGMIVVHFLLVMQPTETEFSSLSLFDGRPTTLFMLLAGMGLTLMTRKLDRARLRSVALKRGAFLLAVGYANLILWPGDILRIYGVIFLLVVWLAPMSSRALVATASFFFLGFMALLFTIDYGQNWDWELLIYHRLWTPMGAFRNLMVDGFRSVFPWAGVLILGMVLGRQDLRSTKFLRQTVAAGLSLWCFAELASGVLLREVSSQSWVMHDPSIQDDLEALLGTSSLPPQLLFLGSAIGLASFVIGASLMVFERWPQWLPFRALAATGQMAFTWYLGHLFLGVFIIYEAGWRTESEPMAIALAGLYCLAISALSFWWRGRGRRGPLESVLRSVS